MYGFLQLVFIDIKWTDLIDWENTEILLVNRSQGPRSVLRLVCAWKSLIIFRHNFVWGSTSEWQSRFSWSTWYRSRCCHNFISDIFVSFFIRCAIFGVNLSAIIWNISPFSFRFRGVLILRFSISETIFAIFLWWLRVFCIGLILAEST